MKKSNVLFMGMLMLITVVAASCTQSKKQTTEKILDHIPDNADVVLVGSLNTIIEAAGGSAENGQITLPSYITENLSKEQQTEWESVQTLVSESGVDTDVCALVAYYEKEESEEYPIFVFHLSDKDKFIDFIEDKGYEETSNENGTVTYIGEQVEIEGIYGTSEQYCYIAVNDTYAYYIPQIKEGMYDPYMTLDYVIGRAAQSPYSKNAFADYMTSGNAISAAIKTPIELPHSQGLKMWGRMLSAKDMPEGVICMNCNMEQEKMTVKAKYMDNDGKPLNAFGDCSAMMDTKAKINIDALAYLGEDECFVEAISLKSMDWDKCMQIASTNLSRTERAMLPMIRQYFEKIDGTVAIGMGLNCGIDEMEKLERTPLTAVSFSLIIETEDNEAKKLITDVQSILESFGLPHETTRDGISMSIPGLDGVIAMEAHDNIIVLANHPIDKCNRQPVLQAFDFKKHQTAMVLNLNREHRLMKELKLKNDILLFITSNAEESEATMELQIKGGKSDGIIANVADMVKTAAETAASLNN